MDIRKLEIFIDLTQTLSYTETAERQFTTQSNISKQILALEKELDIFLFDRTHRKITLTADGALLLPYALAIVDQSDRLQQELAEKRRNEELSLSILTIPTMANYQGFSLVTRFLKKYPKVNLQLKEAEGNQLLPFLEDHHNHLVFTRTFATNIPDYDVFLTEKDHFVAVVAKTHPLASYEKIQLADLKDEKFVLLEKETLMQQPALDLCKQVGFVPQILFKSTRIDLLLNMVSNELGVSLLMEKTIEKNWVDSIKILPITPTKESYLSFIRKKEVQPKASRLFWDYLQDQQDSKHSELE